MGCEGPAEPVREPQRTVARGTPPVWERMVALYGWPVSHSPRKALESSLPSCGTSSSPQVGALELGLRSSAQCWGRERSIVYSNSRASTAPGQGHTPTRTLPRGPSTGDPRPPRRDGRPIAEDP